ncbi:hypothetical protein Thermo_00498 [Thermoplasmatales archaeon]|nr:hypothetical protein Thermo_00498 [Thermoplasmatales archaeon]
MGLLPLNADKFRNIVKGLNDQPYKQWTKITYKESVKKFWAFLIGEDIPKDLMGMLKAKIPKDNGKTSQDLLIDDIQKLIGTARNNRDKCVISLLYESGM